MRSHLALLLCTPLLLLAGAWGGEGPRLACPQAMVACGDSCVDPNFDPRFCGAFSGCSGDERSLQPMRCEEGRVCNGQGSCAVSCAAPLVECEGRCVSPEEALRSPYQCSS